MTAIGELAGRRVKTLLADMNQPLGQAVGNVLEVREAIATLHGGGPEDFANTACTPPRTCWFWGGAPQPGDCPEHGRERHRQRLGLARFRQLVAAQGGDVSFVDSPEKMENARIVETVPSPQSGFLAQIHARLIGEAARGTGRWPRPQRRPD